MKTLLTIFASVLLSANVFAQAPQKMTYQAVVRNSTNALVQNSTIGIKVTLLQGSATGTVVYVETHTTLTNENGLLNIEIGGGTIVSGTYQDGIYWAVGPYFLKTEIDLLGGANYTITSTSELLAVPYALHAKQSLYCLTCPSHYVGELYQGGMIVSTWKVNGLEHGLIMSLVDLNTSSTWNNAILLCNNYQSLSLHDDWYLPNAFELSQCYIASIISQEVLGATNGLQAEVYWSSTSNIEPTVKVAMDFKVGAAGYYGTDQPNNKYRVRAVRRF
jgi:hypothetical protein